jgi:hypothetical protein
LPFLARALGKPGTGAGSVGDLVPRRYNNGYVLPDAGTSGDGLTWHWGYDHPDQLTGEGMLEMTGEFGSIQSDRQSHVDGAVQNWSPDGAGNAPVIQLDWVFNPMAAAIVGINLEWSFMNLDDSRNSQGYSASQESILRQVNVLDRYDPNGMIAPQAPYAGTAGGPGPLLPATPVERSTAEGQILDTDDAHFYNSITSSFDVDMHTVSLGPSVAAHLGRVQLLVSAGPALNLVKWEAEQYETLGFSRNGGAGETFKSWHYQKSGTDVLIGAYLKGSAYVDLKANFFLSFFGRYDWSRTLDADIGPSHFSFDPSGWSAGVGVGYRF